ncbi:hypothetical protein J1N35_008790 [Gossypium stocksii]|uniref:Uncharacterized protein n=1 Tax=Gossypium stocksii TaxID=47602 RepID=A0A9D3WA39_9ROSI|nr:hypothetical protein J1N35_008790 [Gossypium stocksii]
MGYAGSRLLSDHPNNKDGGSFASPLYLRSDAGFSKDTKPKRGCMFQVHDGDSGCRIVSVKTYSFTISEL